ncbi:hypothetical protein L336_1026 [Candidatus Saccharimonas aalborgensis]|uniref:Uncharacterized protein n=1 Tax=Candidatus Saccharimonas aalborgensis TaxID=1332188 RepID=R4PWS9_9BACT|nr:hypothetical protein L336_1026 [Candidatus Saccharimonas aalborgensis]
MCRLVLMDEVVQVADTLVDVQVTRPECVGGVGRRTDDGAVLAVDPQVAIAEVHDRVVVVLTDDVASAGGHDGDDGLIDLVAAASQRCEGVVPNLFPRRYTVSAHRSS